MGFRLIVAGALALAFLIATDSEVRAEDAPIILADHGVTHYRSAGSDMLKRFRKRSRVPGDQAAAKPATPRQSNAWLRVDRSRASPGESVGIEAHGLAPGEAVSLGLVGTGQSFSMIGTAAADGAGSIQAWVTVPDWVEPNQRVRFGLQRQNSAVVAGMPVLIGGAGQGTGGGGLTRATAAMSLEGWIVQGSYECPLLKTPDGRSYALTTARSGRLPVGAYVKLDGHLRRLSNCGGGEATVEVVSFRQTDP